MRWFYTDLIAGFSKCSAKDSFLSIFDNYTVLCFRHACKVFVLIPKQSTEM